MRKELPKEYRIDYNIHQDQLISAVVTCGDKEFYLPAYEINMLLSERCRNNGKFYIDNEEKEHLQE